MKYKDHEEDKCNNEEEDKKDIAFGMSSFLFLIPWAYAQFTFQKAFSIWTISLLLLVCNSYPVDKNVKLLIIQSLSTPICAHIALHTVCDGALFYK